VLEDARAKLAAALQAFTAAQSMLAAVQSALAAGRPLPRGNIMQLDKVRSSLAEAAEALGLDPEQATLADLQARLATRERMVGLRHALEYLGQATGPAVAADQLAPLAADAARLATSESWSPEDEARALVLVRLVELADAASGNGDDERVLVLDAELRRNLGPAAAAVVLAATRGRLALPAHQQSFVAGGPAGEAVPLTTSPPASSASAEVSAPAPSASAAAPSLPGSGPPGPGGQRPPAEPPPPAGKTGPRFPRAVTALVLVILVGLATAVAIIVHDRGSKTTAGTAPQSVSSQPPSPPAAAPGQPSPPPAGTSPTSAPSTPEALPPIAPPPAVDVGAIAAAADPIVVGLTITRATETFGATGIVLNSSGAVVTNDHVIEHALTITARIGSTGRTYSATVVGDSDTEDIALIQLQGASGLQAPKFRDAASLSVGDPVVALWQAPGQGAPTATTATVTALDQAIPAIDPDAPSKTLSGVIQMSVPLTPPASGGPLLNANGEIVGVALAPEPFQPQTGTFGYAVPINTALGAVLGIQQGRSK
jgi:S1-C subfamily serine protease